MKRLIIHTDGGARGNPGQGAIGVVIKDETGSLLCEISRRIGATTNNISEYSAVVASLEWIKKNRFIRQLSNQLVIQFFLDSTLVVNQLNGLFKVKDAILRTYLLRVRTLEQEIGGQISYTYIPREKNSHADFLVNKALDTPFSSSL